MIGLVPMAGKGSRFIAEGYRLPKPFIPIMGQPMFVTAIRSLPPADRYIFICQQSFVEKYPFEQEVQKHYPGARVLTVDGMTEGQACTSLLAEDYLDPEEDMWISAIDSQLVYDADAFNRILTARTVDVAIFTFLTGSVTKKNPLAFAYCRTVEGNRGDRGRREAYHIRYAAPGSGRSGNLLLPPVEGFRARREADDREEHPHQ